MKKVLMRIVVSIVTFFIIILLFLLGCVFILEKGPSPKATELFVNSALETSAGKFLAKIFISGDELEAMVNSNSVISANEVTDSTLLDFAGSQAPDKEEQASGEAIEIIDVSGPTYNGKMMIVKDPSRVTVGISGEYGEGYYGKTVMQIAQKYDAVAAVNGGGFEDPGGHGSGGTPIGLVISNSELKYGNPEQTYEIIGFDKSDVLVVGKMTAQAALDRGVRDAISFGPTLIVNGNSVVVNGSGSGLNPRSAIGQRSDGSILLLVLDGRQVNSIGATYADVIEIMQSYGAVNAANLDGGSSSIMYYKGEYITSSCSIYGPRRLPTTIIVK